MKAFLSRNGPMEVSADESVLSWQLHLITRQPKRPAQIGLVLLAVFALSVCLFHSVWISLVPTLALLFSLSEFVFPVRYLLTPHSAAGAAWADIA